MIFLMPTIQQVLSDDLDYSFPPIGDKMTNFPIIMSFSEVKYVYYE
jgi:hypothetical protein